MKIFVAVVVAAFSLSAHADPLAEFQSIVSRCKEAYAAQPTAVVAFAEKQSAWGKYITRTYGITYDVRKTDSLVSPLAAYIEISQGNDAGFAKTEEDAKALNIDLDGLLGGAIQRIRYAYQDGAWLLVDGKISLTSRSKKDDSFQINFSDPQSRDYLLKRPKTEPLWACLGATKG